MNSMVIAGPMGRIRLTECDGVIVGCAWTGDAERGTAATPLLARAARQLEEYLEGRRTTFDLPMRPAGTPFQQRVWQALTTIPYARTWSYRRLAAVVGDPRAARAVGSANGRNPISILIPCHRVIRTSGEAGGYAGGVETKRRLLALEAVHAHPA